MERVAPPLSLEELRDLELFKLHSRRITQAQDTIIKSSDRRREIIRRLLGNRTTREVGALLGISQTRVWDLARRKKEQEVGTDADPTTD